MGIGFALNKSAVIATLFASFRPSGRNNVFSALLGPGKYLPTTTQLLCVPVTRRKYSV